MLRGLEEISKMLQSFKGQCEKKKGIVVINNEFEVINIRQFLSMSWRRKMLV